MSELERIPVLVVGAGVTGLSASLFLAQQGVHSLLVEQREGTSRFPRARGVNGRTMELMRELGLADEIRAAGESLAPALGIYRGSSLVEVLRHRGAGGWMLRRMRARGVRGHESKKSPTGPCRCPQDLIEPILLRAADKRGVDVRFATLSLIGVMEPGMVGIMEPLFGGPNGHPSGFKNVRFSGRSQPLI